MSHQHHSALPAYFCILFMSARKKKNVIWHSFNHVLELQIWKNCRESKNNSFLNLQKNAHANCANALSRQGFSIHFTFCPQTVQFIHQGFAHFRQLSPHCPHTDFRGNTSFHPLPAGRRCRKSRRSLPEGNTEDYYFRVRARYFDPQLIGQSSFMTRIPKQHWNNCLICNFFADSSPPEMLSFLIIEPPWSHPSFEVNL